ncbi:MAG: class I SAM-dependent methyltransferase [Halanaerobiales bacterium]
MKKIEILKKLSNIMKEDITHITFDDLMYKDEKFFQESIKDDFAGWYIENDVLKKTEFILNNIDIKKGAEILDVACGHGKFAQLLYESGYKVKGIDISETLIKYLNNKYESIVFIRSNMENINFSKEFDLILVLGNSLSLVSLGKAKISLENFHRSLKPGGKIFLELDNKNYFIKNEANTKDWNQYQNRWIMFSEHIYRSRDCIEISRDISIDIKENKIDQYIIIKRLYNFIEIKNLLENSGFNICTAWGNWEGQLKEKGDLKPNLLLLAEKK